MIKGQQALVDLVKHYRVRGAELVKLMHEGKERISFKTEDFEEILHDVITGCGIEAIHQLSTKGIEMSKDFFTQDLLKTIIVDVKADFKPQQSIDELIEEHGAWDIPLEDDDWDETDLDQ